MALTTKKYSSIHSKTGSDLANLKSNYDNNKHLDVIDFPAEAALIYQIQLMQEELDYLRTEISNNKDKTGQGLTTANHTLNFSVSNDGRGNYALTITVVDSSGGKPVTKTVNLNLS